MTKLQAMLSARICISDFKNYEIVIENCADEELRSMAIWGMVLDLIRCMSGRISRRF
ncbi:MAG: hypothetical protein PHZ09_14480 [Eubacteriales bacterium]|nr:hypothetical protein [Eubacteriales bacterium]